MSRRTIFYTLLAAWLLSLYLATFYGLVLIAVSLAIGYPDGPLMIEGVAVFAISTVLIAVSFWIIPRVEPGASRD